MGQSLHSKKIMQVRRTNLRNNLTAAEAFLWTFLKGRQLKGRKFSRQHSIKNYIVDFYCASERLIIELDGEVHNNPEQIAYDHRRTIQLEKLGYRVLRFENKAVFDYLPNVLTEIESCFSNNH